MGKQKLVLASYLKLWRKQQQNTTSVTLKL